MRCLCCNKEIVGNDVNGWHTSCVKSFFGLKDLPSFDFNGSEESFVKEALELLNDTSVTGVQRKLSFYLSKEKNNSRLTLLSKKTPGYILKINSKDFESIAELEHLTMLLAECCKIKVVPHALIKISGNHYTYISKRIDRVDGGKIHMEDFCQLSNKPSEYKYNGSYEKVAEIIDRYSNFSRMDKAELFNRLVFCFITCNSDMHLKNFSLIYLNNKICLSDAYDLVPAQLMVNDPDEVALALNGKKSKLRKNDFIKFGLHIGMEEKTITKLLAMYANKKEEMLRIVKEFDINEELKQKLMNNIIERINRIS
ncbi:MAG: HipA domain-containing protein [Bacilli bacterium]|nr:HipA domain-containing protein [Bacilli bacterium]